MRRIDRAIFTTSSALHYLAISCCVALVSASSSNVTISYARTSGPAPVFSYAPPSAWYSGTGTTSTSGVQIATGYWTDVLQASVTFDTGVGVTDLYFVSAFSPEKGSATATVDGGAPFSIRLDYAWWQLKDSRGVLGNATAAGVIGDPDHLTSWQQTALELHSLDPLVNHRITIVKSEPSLAAHLDVLFVQLTVLDDASLVRLRVASSTTSILPTNSTVVDVAGSSTTSKVSAGLIAGAVIGAVLVMSLLALAIVLLRRRRRSSQAFEHRPIIDSYPPASAAAATSVYSSVPTIATMPSRRSAPVTTTGIAAARSWRTKKLDASATDDQPAGFHPLVLPPPYS